MLAGDGRFENRLVRIHLSNSNQRHHLHAVSGLYRYAQEMEVVPLGYNPVAGLCRNPSAAQVWMPVPQIQRWKPLHFKDFRPCAARDSNPEPTD